MPSTQVPPMPVIPIYAHTRCVCRTDDYHWFHGLQGYYRWVTVTHQGLIRCHVGRRLYESHNIRYGTQLGVRVVCDTPYPHGTHPLTGSRSLRLPL